MGQNTNAAIDMVVENNAVSEVTKETKIIDMALSDKVAGKIYTTRDYDQFKILHGNRDIGSNRTAKVRKSIENVGLLPEPILVNENKEIINGQARYTVCKEKGLPIYYQIVEGAGIDECMKMNSSATKWTQRDYIKSYAATGHESYVFLQRMLDKYALPVRVTISVCNDNFGSACGGWLTAPIASGSFSIDQAKYLEIEGVLAYLSALKTDVNRMKGRKECMYAAIAWAYRHTNVNKDKLASTINTVATSAYLSKVAIGNGIHALTMIEAEYNRGLRGNKKIHFVSLYEDWQNGVGVYASNKR